MHIARFFALLLCLSATVAQARYTFDYERDYEPRSGSVDRYTQRSHSREYSNEYAKGSSLVDILRVLRRVVDSQGTCVNGPLVGDILEYFDVPKNRQSIRDFLDSGLLANTEACIYLAKPYDPEYDDEVCFNFELRSVGLRIAKKRFCSAFLARFF